MLRGAFMRELALLRDSTMEFGRAHPELAPHLGARATNPHVERLIEGVAFLAARTAIRVDAEYERLAQDIVQAIAPDLSCALPPAALVQFKPLLTQDAAARTIVPRNSALRYQLASGEEVHFHTAAGLQLSPVELEVLPPPDPDALTRLFAERGAVTVPPELSHAAIIRARLRTARGWRVGSAIDATLDLQCCGAHAGWLWGSLTRQGATLALVDPCSGVAQALHPQSALRPTGWSDDEALLPPECAPPGPLRLLRESQAWPERFFRMSLDGLPVSLEHWFGDAIDLWWFLPGERAAPELAPDALRLFCCPVVALTRRRCEPVTFLGDQYEANVRLPAGSDGQEIVAVERVDLRGRDGHITPLHPLHDLDGSELGPQRPCYALRRQPRWQEARGKQQSPPPFEWMIAPSPVIEDSALLLVTAWASQSVDVLIPDDCRHWRLDVVAGLQDVVGVGGAMTPIAAASPLPETVLRAMSWRIDRLRGLSPSATATALLDWIRPFCRAERLPPLRGAVLESDVAAIGGTTVPVYARGWRLTIDVEKRAIRDPAFCLWPHVLAATLVRQLQAESFIRCIFASAGDPIGEALAWR